MAMRNLGRVDQHTRAPPELASRPRETITVRRPVLSRLSAPPGGQDHVVSWCADLERLGRVSDEMSDNGSERELLLAAVYGR